MSTSKLPIELISLIMLYVSTPVADLFKREIKEIKDDFMEIESRIGESAALDLLRAYLVENHLCNELVRIAYDPTKPSPGLLRLLATQLLNAFEILK